VDSNDFPSDELSVEFYEFESGSPAEDDLIGYDNITDSGTAQTVWEVPEYEIKDWYVVVFDKYAYTEPQVSDETFFL